MIAPLYDGRSEYEFMQVAPVAQTASGFEIVQSYWQGQMKSSDFEGDWRKALYNGFIPQYGCGSQECLGQGGGGKR